MGIGIVSDLLNKSGKSKIDRRLQVAAARKEADALEALLAKKTDVAQYVIHESLVAKLKWDKIDLVFPLVEDGDAAKGLGAYGFSIAPKNIMTIIVGFALILFAIQKLRGKLHFPQHPATMVMGGCVTGFINGMLSISGPLSSAAFLTLDLSPVSYIASEATTATVMHVVKIVVYGKLNLVNEQIIIAGLGIAVAMIVGNYLAMRFIKNVDKKKYQKVVASCMILLSLFLIISAMC